MTANDKEIKMSSVFIPGGFPTVTYIERKEKQLEERVALANDYLSKLVVVTGATKSGKTVLVDKVFPNENAIWIDGGSVDDEQDFWDTILEKAGSFNVIEYNETNNEENGAEIGLGVEGNVLITKGGLNLTASSSNTNSYSKALRREVAPKVAAINAIQKNRIPLVVDDFHYIEKSIQKRIVRALKAPIMRGLPVIFIAIPNRKYDAVEVEREMTGRIENIEMPVWEEQELARIAERGFETLNVDIDNSLIQKLAESAYGSPFLMQQFCRAVCDASGIKERLDEIQYIEKDIDINSIFSEIAEHSGRSIFNKLKTGPRARSDRKRRLLRNGETTDIYGVVLEGLKALKPGVESLQYEQLRNNIRDVLEDIPPQRHEISRVLDQIAKISYTDTSSTPVIDWQRDDNKLTITDPFFAFFLKWAR